jgi:hypothetical protein
MKILDKIKINLKKYGITLPTFGDGAGTVLDIYPTPDIHTPLSNEEAFKADRDALRSDWQAIGDDMRKIYGKRKR